MPEELQGLLDRIQSEAVKKAEDARSRIVADAQAESDRIIKDATERADALLKKADQDAALLRARAEDAIRQAARDAAISLEHILKSMLENFVRTCVGQAMTPQMMATIIRTAIESWTAKGGGDSADIRIMLPEKNLAETQKAILAGAAGEMKNIPEILVGKDMKSGFKIGFKGGDMFLDFSGEAMTEIICSYVGPKLASIIKAENSPHVKTESR